MSWAGEPDAVTTIRKALAGSNVVSSVALGGSRARGAATALSDWDLYVEGEPEAMMEEIPRS